MRIAMFLDTDFPPDPRVENEATALIKNGHEVYLFSLSYKPGLITKEQINDIKVWRFKAGKLIYKFSALAYTVPVYHWMIRRKIKSYIKAVQPDVLHIHDMPIAKAVFDVNKEFDLPTVLDLHENRPEIMKFYPHLRTGLGKWLIKTASWAKWQDKLIKMADHVVVVTEAAKQVIVRDGLKDHDKIIVVPNTIQPEIFYKYESNNEIKSRFDDKQNILYLGDTSLRRGTDLAVKAMKSIVQHCPDAHLILVGESRDNEILKSLAQEYNVDEYISFEGWQDLTLFPSYIQVSDITLSPIHRNLHHDTTYANKIFQYMAMGKPVVVSNCPAQEAVIEDENCGLVFKDRDEQDLSDKIISLLKDKSLANKLGENGKNAVLKRWNWDITSKSLIEHYSR